MRLAQRRLSVAEVALARSVFGEAIDLTRVLLCAAPWAGVAVTTGSRIWFPRGRLRRDFANSGIDEQAWLVHELTHVWQFQTAPARTLASWAATALRGGYGSSRAGYRYDLPIRFASLGLEAQATVVEHAFKLREGAALHDLPAGAQRSDYHSATPFTALCL